MTLEETSNLKIDPRIQFRCSSVEERDFFQNEINRSGMKPQQYFKAAVEAFKMQALPEESEQKKALAEVDILTNRLNQINRSQLMIAFEIQEQAKKELQELNRERGELEEYKKGLEEKLHEEFKQKNQELEAKFNDLVLQNEEKKKLELEVKDNEILSLRDTLENHEAKIKKLLNDYDMLQKQFDDKNKLNIAYEDREFESKKRIMVLEDKLKTFDKMTDLVRHLEIKNAVLESKIESISNESKIIIEHLNKEIVYYKNNGKQNEL